MDLYNEVFAQTNAEELFDFVSYFHIKNHYSLYNGMLVYIQRPGAVMLATANRWEKEYRRYIKHEATPIVIVRPFGPVEFIYDYSDTYGDEELFPKRCTLSRCTEIEDGWLPKLTEILRANGILYAEKNFGTIQSADLTFLKQPRSYIYKCMGREKEITTDCCITANSMCDNAAKFEAVIHELAHLYCGHLPRGEHTPKNIKFSSREKEKLTVDQMECEAEITTQMVFRILGMDLDISEYLKGYGFANGKKQEISYNEMVKAADKILDLLPPSISESAMYSLPHEQSTSGYQPSMFDMF